MSLTSRANAVQNGSPESAEIDESIVTSRPQLCLPAYELSED